MTNDLGTAAVGGADAGWLTTTNLVLIAVGVVLAILVIWYGARLKRERKAVDDAIQDRAEDGAPAPAPRTVGLDDTPPPAPETEPLPPVASTPEPAPVREPEPEPEPVTAPAVAPAPPPLAGDSTPVVATAPFDPAPATIAADLATPPAAPPEPEAAAPGERVDDLTRMKGVGPKLAARLNELGITRYAQIAALSPTEADALDRQLGSFQGRMARDRWVEQAGYLATDDRAGFEAAFGKL